MARLSFDGAAERPRVLVTGGTSGALIRRRPESENHARAPSASRRWTAARPAGEPSEAALLLDRVLPSDVCLLYYGFAIRIGV
jgi:hypothetical protein